jgi:tetratricopeptide (TPR) repeat protein
MSEKKKSPAAKMTDRRMTKPQGTRPAKTSETVTGTAPEGAVAVAQPQNSARQLSSFEAAMKLFHARKLQEARALFETAAAGPERDVAQRARLHIAMCDRRLQQATAVNLGSAEDYYNYGIALINSRNIGEARVHLERALQMAPGSDHIHYALALAQALSGDVANAYENLKRAIELEPRNRIMARQDADFAPLANQPPFDALLYPEKKGW